MSGDVPVAVLLLLAAWLLVWSGQVRWWLAFLLVAAGVALGQNPVAEGIVASVWWFVVGPFTRGF
ncbi:hypothetical protein ACL02R_29415 [Streptomyces sp. MS19]|uniref:hypothetical protein n=1 Tax=Streptomyces sp. MS19 TaxID=3385972 RepID=UPI0039A000D8